MSNPVQAPAGCSPVPIERPFTSNARATEMTRACITPVPIQLPRLSNARANQTPMPIQRPRLSNANAYPTPARTKRPPKLNARAYQIIVPIRPRAKTTPTPKTHPRQVNKRRVSCPVPITRKGFLSHTGPLFLPGSFRSGIFPRDIFWAGDVTAMPRPARNTAVKTARPKVTTKSRDQRSRPKPPRPTTLTVIALFTQPIPPQLTPFPKPQDSAVRISGALDQAAGSLRACALCIATIPIHT